MSVYSNLSGKEPQWRSGMRGVKIGGSFACQFCELVADEAEHQPVSRILSWKCDNGHVSVIEDFNVQ